MLMKCPNCTAELRLDPSSHKLVCDYCGTSLDPKTVEKEKQEALKTKSTVRDTDAQTQTMDFDGFEMTVYTCSSCGAELLSSEDTAVTFCSYCGSQNILRSRVEKVRKPSRIIPFMKSREECEKAYRQSLKKALFAPARMAETQNIEKFRGIYMPFWVYSLGLKGAVFSSGSRSYRKGDYIYTDHYRLRSQGKAEYHGLAYDASANFSDNISRGVVPYDLGESAPFDTAYLSGFYADLPDVQAEVYYEAVRNEAGEDLAHRLKGYREYGHYGVSESDLRSDVSLCVDKEEVALFPVWFLGTKSRDGKRISYAAVNGQTGKVAAETPISFWKYLLGSVVLAIPIFFLLNLFLTLTPKKALLTAIVLACVSIFIINGKMNEVYIKENKLDDAGLSSRDDPFGMKVQRKTTKKKRREKAAGKRITADTVWLIIGAIFVFQAIVGSGFLFSSIGLIFMVGVLVAAVIFLLKGRKDSSGKALSASMPLADKLKYLAKPLISIGIAIAALILSPTRDYWYYGAAVVSFVLIALTFRDIIREHNLLTSRKLPQLEKRGGDENA